MPKLKWLAVCERALVEAEANTLSLISLLEQVRLRAVPPLPSAGEKPIFLPHRFTVVQYWTRSKADKPESADVRVRLISTDGKVFGTIDQTVDLTTARNVRAIAVAPGFPWTGPGELRVQAQIRVGKAYRTVGTETAEVLIDAGAQPIDPGPPDSRH